MQSVAKFLQINTKWSNAQKNRVESRFVASNYSIFIAGQIASIIKYLKVVDLLSLVSQAFAWFNFLDEL